MENKKTKMTNMSMLTSLRDFITNRSEPINEKFDNEEYVNKLTKMIESMENKALNAKQTPQQIENEQFKTMIYNYLTTAEAPKQAQEIWRAIPELFNHPTMNNQRVSSLLRAMKGDGRVKSETVKGKSLFSVM